MPLGAGTRLGPYEILDAIGAGGMGEVYRARDTRLDRTVAVKVLPAHLSGSPELRQRFEREARAVSSLNHPHICILYDIGRQDEIDFLVMEYLDGETLARRLERGPLPIADVLTIGLEMADALDKAHRQGVVHRDLKPGNIMLTKAGAKLMDFGLAKPVAPAVQTADGSGLPTLSVPITPITQQGTIVGTFQYMAPEQVEGREADARSDIFSLGVILYEMVTGKRAFDGKSAIAVASAILQKQPDPVSTLQPMAPPALEHLIGRALDKDPDKRWQSAQDMKAELAWVRESGSRAGVPAPVLAARRYRQHIVLGAGVLGWVLAAAALVGVFVYSGRVRSLDRLTYAEIEPPPGSSMTWVLLGPAAISPDGSRLVYVGGGSDEGALLVRDMTSGKTQRLGGTSQASFPFWSPDSQMIAFYADGKLKKVSATGGPVTTLADAPGGRGGSWSQAGVIVFTPNIEDELYKVSDAGGTPTALTRKTSSDVHGSNRNPTFLPDGKHYLYIHRTSNQVGSVMAGALDGGEPKMVLEQGSNVQYADGYLFYIRDGNLVAQPFDTGALELRGKPVALAEKVEYYNPRDFGNFSLSRTGALIYRTSAAQQNQIAWVDRDGRDQGAVSEPGSYENAVLSPDGRLVVTFKDEPSGQNGNLWVIDTEHKTVSRLTFQPAGGGNASFSPDGKTLATALWTGWGGTVALKAVASGGQTQKVADYQTPIFLGNWTPDGSSVLFLQQNAKTGWDIGRLPLQGDHKASFVLAGDYDEEDGQLSPNGKWIAYESSESGKRQIYVAAFPGPGGKWQVSVDGGQVPVWSRDGKTLYYESGDKVMAVDIRNAEQMDIGATHTLFSLPPQAIFQDVSPDGKRFLILRPAGQQQAAPLTLVLNWQKLLEKQ